MNKDLKKQLWLSKPGNPPEDLIEKEVTVDDQIDYLVKQIEDLKRETEDQIRTMHYRMTICPPVAKVVSQIRSEATELYKDNMRELQFFMENSKGNIVKWSHLFFGGVAATITYLALHYV